MFTMSSGEQAAERTTLCSDDDEKRAALKAILESKTFTRCDQLCKFLQYVTDMSIAGRSREITEYLIAVEALGRPAGFSPADDSSVRSRAQRESRRRLQEVLRVGRSRRAGPDRTARRARTFRNSLAPRPTKRCCSVVTPPPPSSPPAPISARTVWPRSAIVAVAVAVAAVGILAVLLLRVAPFHRPSPILQQAWGPLARAESSVLLCVASPLHLVVRPYMSVVAEGLSKYPAPDELYALYRQHRPLPAGTKLDMHPVDNSIQMGRMGAVITLTVKPRFSPWALPFRCCPSARHP